MNISEGAVVTIIVACIVSLPPTIVALRNGQKTDRLHTLINSNLARQIASEVAAAYSRGIIEGAGVVAGRDPEKREEVT